MQKKGAPEYWRRTTRIRIGMVSCAETLPIGTRQRARPHRPQASSGYESPDLLRCDKIIIIIILHKNQKFRSATIAIASRWKTNGYTHETLTNWSSNPAQTSLSCASSFQFCLYADRSSSQRLAGRPTRRPPLVGAQSRSLRDQRPSSRRATWPPPRHIIMWKKEGEGRRASQRQKK